MSCWKKLRKGFCAQGLGVIIMESYFLYIIDSVGMKETIGEDQGFLNTRPYFSFTRYPERVQRPGILLTQV